MWLLHFKSSQTSDITKKVACEFTSTKIYMMSGGSVTGQDVRQGILTKVWDQVNEIRKKIGNVTTDIRMKKYK